jgi:hypothetical protein
MELTWTSVLLAIAGSLLLTVLVFLGLVLRDRFRADRNQ